jgi:opacity protein-like surface antigen
VVGSHADDHRAEQPGTIPPGTPRTTPDGAPYNYDNGYVLPDISGGAGGQTWNWGYDNSAPYPAGQISSGGAFPPNTILMSRSTVNSTFSSPSLDDDPHIGAEIVYDRHIISKQDINYGIEGALNFLNLSIHDNGSFMGSATRTTDAYAYTPGTTPPGASPGNTYQGSFGGFGYLIGDAPVASSTAVIPGGYTISGTHKVEGTLWGMRLGPYADYAITERFNVWVSAGLAVGFLNADASWSETITLPSTATLTSMGSGSDTEVLWGWYLGANLSWDINDRWSVIGSVQFQDLGTYSHDFGGRTVELDLSKSIFITLGMSWRF